MHRQFAALLIVAIAATPRLSAQIAPPLVRDSAGVRIVEHRTIRNPPLAFVISPTVQFDLGGLKDNPDGELDSRNPFASALRLSDGRYAVSDYASIKMFDAKGQFVRTVGRSGNGPGEFRQLRETCVATGDTLVAIGYGDRRVSVFDSSGKHVRSFVAPGYSSDGACFSDGSVVVHANRRPNPNTTMTPERAASLDVIEDLQRVRTDGAVLGTIAWGNAEVYSGAGTITNAVASRDRLYVGDGRTADVRVYSIAGALVQLLRWNDPLTPYLDGATPAAIQTMRGAPPQAPRPHLDKVPAYGSIFVDEIGRVWLADHFSANLPAPGARGWTVFDPQGNLLGRVLPPAIPGAQSGRVEIVRVYSNHVIARWRDTDSGALHISVHALTPRAQ